MDWRFLLLVHCYCYYSLAFFLDFAMLRLLLLYSFGLSFLLSSYIWAWSLDAQCSFIFVLRPNHSTYSWVSCPRMVAWFIAGACIVLGNCRQLWIGAEGALVQLGPWVWNSHC